MKSKRVTKLDCVLRCPFSDSQVKGRQMRIVSEEQRESVSHEVSHMGLRYVIN